MPHLRKVNAGMRKTLLNDHVLRAHHAIPIIEQVHVIHFHASRQCGGNAIPIHLSGDGLPFAVLLFARIACDVQLGFDDGVRAFELRPDLGIFPALSRNFR